MSWIGYALIGFAALCIASGLLEKFLCPKCGLPVVKRQAACRKWVPYPPDDVSANTGGEMAYFHTKCA